MKAFTAIALLLLSTGIHALGCSKCCKDPCSPSNFRYCDSSSGRYVTKEGYFSSCYCTKTAIMDLTVYEGCCLWQGGVLKVTDTGIVICNTGIVSESCSLQQPQNNGFSGY